MAKIKLKKTFKAIDILSINLDLSLALFMLPSGYWDISTIDNSFIYETGNSIKSLNELVKDVLNEK